MPIQTLVKQTEASVYVTCFPDDVMPKVNSRIQRSFYEHNDTSKTLNLSIEAVKYHLSKPGQQFRAKVCLDVCIKLGVICDDMLTLAAVAELLHNASLIHDDIQDGDESRRNQPTVCKKFGRNVAICAGDLLLSTAYGILAEYSQPKLLPKLISTIHEQTRSTIEGQSKDIAYKNSPYISIEEYVEIATLKSGGLLNLPIELALIAADKNSFIELARKASAEFAVGYQIADDLDDITKDAVHKTECQSVNIIFVLNTLGYTNAKQKAVSMCQYYLNNSIDYSQQLPNGSGLLLTNLAEKLKNKISK
jgi:geranylgeranyl pyrophosphate synthase